MNTNFKELVADMDHLLIQKWAKDYKAPIAYFEKDYVAYFLERLFNYNPSLITALEQLKEDAKSYDDPHALIDYQYAICNKMMQDIKSRDTYNTFTQNTDMNKYAINVDIPHNRVNCPNYNGRTLVSIDIAKANYQVSKLFGILTPTDGDTWEEYVSHFTDSQYLANSKKIRQIVFGNCIPKRLTTLERYYNCQVLNYLLENIVPKDKVIAFYDDEIIIEYSTADPSYYNNLTKSIKEATNVDVFIEVYELEHVFKDFCIKHHLNKPGYTIMGVPQKRFLQALNYAENRQTTNEYDLIFWDDDAPARYLNNIYEKEERDIHWLNR